jgi:putative ABC transport system ATP-binding protein
VLRIRELAKRHGGPRPRTVFAGIDFDVAAGEYVAVMGESGIGKSTLLNLIAGLDAPDAGSIALDDVELVGLDDDALTLLRREKMGFVFQAFHVLPYLSVAQNVAVPLMLLGRGTTQTKARVATVLDAVGLGERAASLPRELSGGELQRVAIARALVHEPRLVLADEPTGNLDPETSASVFAMLMGLVRETGLAALIATHNLDLAARMDRCLRLDGGRVVEG